MVNIKKQNFVSEDYYNPPPKKYQVPFLIKLIIFLIFLFCLITYASFMVYKKSVQNNFITNLNSDYVNLQKINAVNILNNEKINFNNYTKNNFILINLWASWCNACMQEMPSLIKLTKDLENDVSIIAISLDDDIEAVKKYADSIQHKLSIFWNKDKSALSVFNVTRYPETFLLTKDGKIIKQFSGAIDWRKEEILKYIQ